MLITNRKQDRCDFPHPLVLNCIIAIQTKVDSFKYMPKFVNKLLFCLAQICPNAVLIYPEDKFSKLDKYYDAMRDTTHRESCLGMEDRILSYQRQLEERSRSEVKLEVSRVIGSKIDAVYL